MTVRMKDIWQLVTLLMLLSMMGCTGPLPVEGTTVLPTAPATLPEVIDALSSYSAEARITAALALSKYGKEAVEAVPALIQNLHYETTSDVREAAAIALGRLGPDARNAVPDLIDMLQNDNSVNVRSAAAEALGQIGDPLAVPALASILHEKEVAGRTNIWLAIHSAVSIAQITGEKFPDADLQDGHRLNEEGIPLVAIAAREWWEKEGQFQNWDNP
jgi:HEAT repeat protein